MEKQLEKKWFNTGFMAGGVKSVDAGTHTLTGAVVIRPGEALGHGVWIDKAFCQSIVDMASTGKLATAGIKARFGHPNMCSDALGTFLGRWKNFSIDEAGFVRGDLHLSSTASESPKGDLRKYVEEMAAKEPDHFGASIVFSVDSEAMDAFMLSNCDETKQFKSPDALNVNNLPHARCAELHAADLVDDPAATDGMFSGAAGLSLAGQMTEFLDTHPEIFKAFSADPKMIDIVSRYSNELEPFFKRYTENLEKKVPIAEPITQPPPAEPDVTLQAELTKAMTLNAESVKNIESLTGQISGLDTLHKQALESVATQTERADKAESKLKLAEDIAEQKIKDLTARAELAESKLKAIEAGAPPLSASHASEGKAKTPCLFKTGK
jgi:hypothetical protein